MLSKKQRNWLIDLSDCIIQVITNIKNSLIEANNKEFYFDPMASYSDYKKHKQSLYDFNKSFIEAYDLGIAAHSSQLDYQLLDNNLDPLDMAGVLKRNITKCNLMIDFFDKKNLFHTLKIKEWLILDILEGEIKDNYSFDYVSIEGIHRKDFSSKIIQSFFYNNKSIYEGLGDGIFNSALRDPIDSLVSKSLISYRLNIFGKFYYIDYEGYRLIRLLKEVLKICPIYFSYKSDLKYEYIGQDEAKWNVELKLKF